MDYSSVDSELIESLDLLRPPVKRNYRNINRGYFTNPGEQKSNIEDFKDFCVKISAGTQHPQIHLKDIESSTSLVLNKTKQKVLEKYSVLSYTNLLYSKQAPDVSGTNPTISKDKPLIKVTVIPKATQTRNVLIKRKPLPKRVQTTVSNQDNSIQTKNIYLVVPSGRKKEKVYQIKTTGSAKLVNDYNRSRDEVIPIKQLSSLKLILDSLNMERKKEKNKKRRKKPMADLDCLEPPKTLRDWRECTCSNDREEISPDVTCTKSFVRIMGSLGLNNNDQYVLRCAATVNDKPDATDFTDITSAQPIACEEERRNLNMCDLNTCPTRCFNNITNPTFHYSQKRDIKVQTAFQNNDYFSGFCARPPKMCSKETQATQADFEIGVPSNITNFPSYKDEIAQCRCTNKNVRECLTESDTEDNALKACQSPLVVISVYPIPDCPNVTLAENRNNDNKKSSAQKTIICSQNLQQGPYSGNSNMKEKKYDIKSPRTTSRSPSPNRNLNRTSNKPNLAEPVPAKPRRTSPEREFTTVRNSRQSKPIRDRSLNKTINAKEHIRDKSPQRSPQRKDAKGTNTDHNITKKMLVDNYTKKLTAYMDNNPGRRNVFPKRDPSKIALNIDGVNEHYDVLFELDNANTGLKVKKTAKTPTPVNNLKDIFPRSMKCSITSEQPRRTFNKNEFQKQNDDPPLKTTFSRLHLRDSLEITHRHDNNTGKLQHNKTFKSNNSNELFSAPIKHYRGDDCRVSDPMKREKEIRSLLGVDKGVHASIAQDSNVEKKNFAVPVHYFYNKTCEKKIVAGINLMGVQSPCACCEIRKSFYNGSGSYPSRPMTPPAQPQSIHSGNHQNLHVPSRTQQQEANDKPESNENTEEDNIKTIRSKSHIKSMGNTGTQYETQVQRTSLYQQLILNRNIQVFLQVDQFTKQKPIVLSRKQYDKVKRTIENTIANKTGREYKRKKCICRTSLVSVGDVRRKPKLDQPANGDGHSNNEKKDLGIIAKRSSSQSNKSVRIRETSCACRVHNNLSKHTLVLFSKETKAHPNCVDVKPVFTGPRQTISSMELRYSDMSNMKNVTFSSTNVEIGSISTAVLEQKESHSVQTIFKGHKKCHTPNLGTSLFSLCCEEKKPLALETRQEPKKKPFLRRLMSCLVMRSTRVSVLNNEPSAKAPSVESSIDSYHISTSLGAIEVSSSMYDTSASFYTNHSIYPINSKMKRGFFSSVREFITSRKS